MPDTDDFFEGATVKNAPRHYPNAFRVIAGITAGLFIGGGIWGAAQVAYGLNAKDASMVAPAILQQGESNYYADHQQYTNDLSKLTDGSGKAVTLPSGVTATVIGLCDDGWLAKISGALGSNVHYVSGSASTDNPDITTKLADAKLPSCVTVESLRKSGVTVKVSENSIKVTDVQIRRSKTVGNQYGDTFEGIHVAWKADANCMADVKPQYEVTVQQQKPEGEDSNGVEDDLDMRTFDSTKTALNIDSITNGSTYDVKVYAACAAEFAGVAPVTKTYTQPLPPASIKVLYDTMANANGGVFPLVSASSSHYVSYDIQYRKSYASGWTTLIRNYVSGGPVRRDGYFAGYGDQFRARAVSLDGKQVGDWGSATTLRYTGF